MACETTTKYLGTKRRLKLNAAIAAALLSGYGSRQVFAGTCTGSTGTYTCSGAVNSTTDVTQYLNAGLLTITTTPGFGIDTTTTGGNAFRLATKGASLSFTDSNLSNITGADFGINATNYGTGATNITVSGTVTGTTDDGIFAYNSNYSTDLTINAASVSGGQRGIIVTNYSYNAVSITTTGTVTGTTDDGIFAYNSNYSTDLTINAANVSGMRQGINAINNGTGTTSITTNGAVISVGQLGAAGISNNTLNASIITLNSGAAVSSGSGVAIADLNGDTSITVNTGASVTGDITLSNGTDDLSFTGGDFSGVTLFDGGDGFTDSLSFTGSSGGLTASTVTNFETIQVANATINNTDNSTLVTGNVAGYGLFINNAGTFAAGTEFNLTGNLTINTGGEFDGRGNSPSISTITGNLSNSGVVNMQDSETNDSLTVTGNYTGASGTLNMDVQLDDGAVDVTDILVIDGDTSGTTMVNINNAGGAGAITGTGPTDGILIIDVSGTSSATAFELAGGSITAGNFTYTLRQNAADGNWYLQSALPPPPAVIPTLSGWLLTLLASLLAAFGIRKTKRRELS